MDDPSKYLALIGSEVEVTVDRPLGSVHPELPTLRYRTNYGYLPGTLAGDGEEIDAYVLGIEEPLDHFSGICVAVILRKNDDEHKVVVASGPLEIEAIKDATFYIEGDFDSEVIIEGGA